jgi:hypothetical protein
MIAFKNKSLTVSSQFWYRYMFPLFLTIIGLSILYCKVRLKMCDKYVRSVGSYKFTKVLRYEIVKKF